MLNTTDLIIYIAVALGLGIVIAASYMFKTKTSRSFLATLALLPALVCVVIMMVNGSIGAGVAVAGTFSLVRFRSAPGTAREITAVFLAMAVGLATGMGYIGIAAVFAVVISAILLVMSKFLDKKEEGFRILKITVPENLEFEGVFENVLAEYTDYREMTDVKTTNMGTLYKLTYKIRMKQGSSLKKFIDSLREQNGNLEISCGYPSVGEGEL